MASERNIDLLPVFKLGAGFLGALLCIYLCKLTYIDILLHVKHFTFMLFYIYNLTPVTFILSCCGPYLLARGLVLL